MPTADKTSLRKEFDQIRSEYLTLQKTKKIPKDFALLVSSLFMLMELMITVFMEKKTAKNSRNSHRPSSQTQKDETSVGKTGTNGKGPRRNGERSKNFREKIKTISIPIDECDHCGEDLSSEKAKVERRTKIDILFEKQTTHYDSEMKVCPECDGTSKGRFPEGVSGPLQYGNGLKAFIINLMFGQMVSLNRVQKMIQSLIGQVISEATMLKYTLQLDQALQGWEEQAISTLLESKSMHCDETSLRVDKKNHWIHVYSGGDTVVKKLHPKRGMEAIEEIGILPRYDGYVIHDCWASYLAYDHFDHGLCGSHLLRELTFIVESNGYRWAKNMKRLLKETVKIVSKRKRKKLSSKEYKRLEKRYRNILTRGMEELPKILRKKKTRGRIAKSDAHNLFERFQKYEQAVLAFARVAEVSFTNNRAERDLRMAKVKQKVSGCFRSFELAQAYCRISSYLQTMAYKGYDPMIAIQIALEGRWSQK